MNIQLTPELEKLVAERVQSGRYNSVNELFQHALRLLEERDEAAAYQKLEIGKQIDTAWEQSKRGELIDGDEVFDRFDSELATMEQAKR